MFRLGLIGLGGWGRRLVNSVNGKSGITEFTAAVTRTPAKAEAFAGERYIRLCDDIAELLSDDGIDGIVVASPAALHCEQAMAAVAAGKHVMVIKPLATSHADAAALYAAAEGRGVLVAMGYDRCFSPAVNALRRRVRDGDLGRIFHAEGDFCVDRMLGMTDQDWKTDPATFPPGSLADHMLYTMIELMGPVASLKSTGVRQVVQHDFTDTATVDLRFANGATGHLTAIGVTPNFHRLHLFGEKGWAEIRGDAGFEYRPLDGVGERITLDAIDNCREQLESFAEAAYGRRDYPIPPNDALAGVAALDAMRESVRTGEAVTLAP